MKFSFVIILVCTYGFLCFPTTEVAVASKCEIQDDFGKHFIIGFTGHEPLVGWSDKSSIFATIIPKANATVTVSSSNFNKTLLVIEKQSVILPIPNDIVTVKGKIRKNGIEITSTADIAVVCAYRVNDSTDPVGYLAKPSRFLGKKYVVATDATHGYFGIIASENDTTVKITFSIYLTYNGTVYPRGGTFSTTLSRLETLDIEVYENSFSGTVVEASKNISVVSGSLGIGGRRLMMSSLNPVERWGYTYIMTAEEQQYTVGVYAYEDIDDVYTNNYKCQRIRSIERIKPRMLSMKKTDSPTVVNCTKLTCQVVLFQHGASEGPPMTAVRPLCRFSSNNMTFVNPRASHTFNITFLSDTSNGSNECLNAAECSINGEMVSCGAPKFYKHRNTPANTTFKCNDVEYFPLFNKWSTTSHGGTAVTIYESFSHLANGSSKTLKYMDIGSRQSDFGWPPVVNCKTTCALVTIPWPVSTFKRLQLLDHNLSQILSKPKDIIQGDASFLVRILSKLVQDVKPSSKKVAVKILETFDKLLNVNESVLIEAQRLDHSSSRAIQTIDKLLETVSVTESKPFHGNLDNFAFLVSLVKSSSYSGQTFFTDGSVNTTSNTSIANQMTERTSISFPKMFFHQINKTYGEQETVIFSSYKKTVFFQTQNAVSEFPKLSLNSFVMCASIKGRSISGLKSPIQLTFAPLRNGHKSSAMCVYWDILHSRWSSNGSTTVGSTTVGSTIVGSSNVTYCQYDHLTGFAMLMDINVGESTGHEEVLSIISYIGCAVSLVGLTLTIVTILMFRELNNNRPTQILLNFCISLSLTLIVFLAGAETSRTFSMTGCRIAAIALHYFVLTTFMWMAISAFSMYLAFVKVMNSYLPKFMLKCSILAWGVPIVIVAITAALALDDYGDSKYCRLLGIPFLAAFLAPVLLIVALNTIGFILIFHSLLKTGRNVTPNLKMSGYQQARQGAAIFVLLGLTWVFGVLAISDAKIVFQYLFCIFNSLQGLFVFLLYCLLSPTTREKYRRFWSKKMRYKVNEKPTKTQHVSARRRRAAAVLDGDARTDPPRMEMQERNVPPYTLSSTE